MNQAVESDTPTLAAVSRSVIAQAMQEANVSQAAGASLELASSPIVLAVNVLPQPRHSQRWPPSRSRPLRTNRSHPHRGQRPGRPGSDPAATSRQIASLILSPTASSSSTVASCGRSGRMSLTRGSPLLLSGDLDDRGPRGRLLGAFMSGVV